MRTRSCATLVASLIAAATMFGLPADANAQLKGHYIPGFTGAQGITWMVTLGYQVKSLVRSAP